MSATTPVCAATANHYLPRHFHGRVYLDADIYPSAIYRRLVSAIALAIALAIVIAYIPSLIQLNPASLFMLLLLAGVYASGRWALGGVVVTRLRLDQRGWHLAVAGGELVSVTPRPEARLWPHLVVMEFCGRDGKRYRLLVLPDTMAADDYHRLRVWLVTQRQSLKH